MLVFRCTQRVITRFGLVPSETSPASSGLLGDWYANLLNVGRSRFVLCVSERTLLPVLMPARNDLFPSAFPSFLQPVLESLSLDSMRIEYELTLASEVTFARSRSRRVLGVMNDFAFHAGYLLSEAAPRLGPVEAALDLARMPSKPIGYDTPERVVRALFKGSSAH